jgi:hypothetical protein
MGVSTRIGRTFEAGSPSPLFSRAGYSPLN